VHFDTQDKIDSSRKSLKSLSVNTLRSSDWDIAGNNNNWLWWNARWQSKRIKFEEI